MIILQNQSLFNSIISTTNFSALCTQLQGFVHSVVDLPSPHVHSIGGAFPFFPKYKKQSLLALALAQNNKTYSKFTILISNLSLRLIMTQLFIAFFHIITWSVDHGRISKSTQNKRLKPLWIQSSYVLRIHSSRRLYIPYKKIYKNWVNWP